MTAADSEPARPWDQVYTEQRFSAFRDALIKENGNVTRAGALVGVKKRQAMRLALELGLRDFARQLRSESGQVMGRPKSISKKGV